MKRDEAVPIQYSDMVTSAQAATRSSAPTTFQQYWLAETIRLRESQWGPLQDSKETRRARALGRDFAQRLLLRATYLGQREGMDDLIRHWTGGARLAFFVLLALALLTGSAAALGALGDGTRPVNIILALTALLGLHSLTFLFWCASSALPYGGSHTGLGDVWLWLTRKMARGPDAALVPRALLGLLSQHHALRSLLGAISHALWSAALVAMLLTLVGVLSARRYVFSWETTLLSPDTFVGLTRGLGWLPSKLGFDLPSEAIIRASDGLQTLPDYAQTQWSGWLIGCLVCYGLLPRVLALLVTTITSVARLKNLSLDTRRPGYIELRDRLDPPSQPGGIDAPAPPQRHHKLSRDASVDISGLRAIVGLELAPDEVWPPAPLAGSISDLGIIDDRLQRQQLLDSLHTHPPARLLIVCDGRQTPDRGVITLITEVASMVKQTRVLVVSAAPPDAEHGQRERRSVWTRQLQNAGWPAEEVYIDPVAALAWLTSDAGADSPGATS